MHSMPHYFELVESLSLSASHVICLNFGEFHLDFQLLEDVSSVAEEQTLV